MSWSHYIYPSSSDFKKTCVLYSLKHLQRCIQMEKDGGNESHLYNKNITDVNSNIPNVSTLKTKEACINVMCQYDIGLEANIDDLIMGDHIKVMLKEERDKYLDTLTSLNQVIHNSTTDYLIELQEQLKLERA